MSQNLLKVVLLIIVSAGNVYSQRRVNEIICSSDTLVIQPHWRMEHISKSVDTLDTKPYKVVQCRTSSDIGLRLEIGVSNYYYGKKTTNWIGQHGSPNFNVVLSVNNLNFGFRAKPWTIDPKKEMEFNGSVVPTTAKLNAIKIDYYGGYSFDFRKLISIEPYVGYNSSSFLVINEDELKQEFSFANTGGLLLGSTFNKYFKIKEYEYISAFGTLGYGFVNFKKVHPELDNGYFEWSAGISYKGFFTKRFNRRVN